jgi:hypothetical protein
MKDPDSPPSDPQACLALAQAVMRVLQQHSVDALVIGGFALAAHNYARATDDLDLGVSTHIEVMRTVAQRLADLGFQTEFREPDGFDALGGVIDVQDAVGGFVQVVNFDNSPAGGFPAAIRDALASAPELQEGAALRVIPLPYLVALKLYAGGPKSESDILHLLESNPDVDREAIRSLCMKYGLRTGGVL